jgi:uncharacterized protein involved in outer membrane biogenesis
MNRGHGIIKKLAIAFVGLVLVLVAAAVIIPLLVDVDQYRPQLTAVVNDRINGKFELGKLKLSLWGQVRVEVAGVELSDVQGRKMVAVKDAFFHLPFFSILSGSPVLTFKMDRPELNVAKDKSGKINVLTLMKETPKAEPSVAKEQRESKPIALPLIATRARLGVEFKDAFLTYKDELTDLTTQVKDLNVALRDISLSRPIELEVSANLDTNMGKTMTVRGPVWITGKAQANIADGKIDGADAQFKADFDQLEILMGDLFHKARGIPANAQGIFKSSAREARIERFEVRFHNVEVKTTGTISNLNGSSAGQPGASPVVDLNIKSNEIALQPWSELVPMLKDFALGGSASFEASAKGSADKLNYQAHLGMKEITAKAPKLKAQPRINGTVDVVTDKVERFLVTMTAPGNDLKVEGKLVSFTKPQIEAQVTSSEMDLDQLVEFPPPKAKAERSQPVVAGGAPTASAPVGGAQVKTPVVDFDALLDPLRDNMIAGATQAKISVNMKMLKAYGVKMTDVTSQLSLRELAASIDQFQMKLFGGSIKATASTQLKPKAPTYHFNADIASLDLQQAVESQFALLKNTILGKAFLKIDGGGASFNPDPAKLNLNAKGSMKVENATFATIDVGRMTTEAINKALDRVGEKVSQAKGKSVKSLGAKESQYEFISSDFTISGGKFSAPNFVAKAAPNAGIDLKGSTIVGLTDFSVKANWEVIDTYNLTHARDLSVDVAGTQVPHLLAEGDKPVRFPVSVGCNLMAPCYSYTEVPEFLAHIALSNLTRGVEGKAKAELRKKVEEKAKELTEKASPQVQDAIKGLGKKLFGR